jgi:hypothetical protein
MMQRDLDLALQLGETERLRQERAEQRVAAGPIAAARMAAGVDDLQSKARRTGCDQFAICYPEALELEAIAHHGAAAPIGAAIGEAMHDIAEQLPALGRRTAP